MTKIISDNKETGETLEKLVSLVLENGGRIDEHVVLKCEDGNLSVHTDSRATNAGPILKLPPECLIPTEAFELTIVDSQLRIDSHAPDLSSARLDLLETMISLFNQTGKLTTHEKNKPVEPQ